MGWRRSGEGRCSGGWQWPTVNATYEASVLARITLGELDSELEGAEVLSGMNRHGPFIMGH